MTIHYILNKNVDTMAVLYVHVNKGLFVFVYL